MPISSDSGQADSSGLSSSLRRNIETLRERRRQELMDSGKEDKLANAITAFTGSMRSRTASIN